MALSALALVPAAAAGTTTTPAKHAATTTTKAKGKTKATAKAPLGATGKRCWNDLIRDWYDGRIDKTYPVHCYKDALRHLPNDVKTYSDAYDVISRALADATRKQKRVDPNALVPPPGGGGGGGGGGKTSTTNPFGPGGPSAAGGPINDIVQSGDRGANGIPIPLIVLGGLALLLVAAGAAGLIARRVQARRAGGDHTA